MTRKENLRLYLNMLFNILIFFNSFESTMFYFFNTKYEVQEKVIDNSKFVAMSKPMGL